MRSFHSLPIAVAVSLCFANSAAFAEYIEVAEDQVYSQDIDIQNTADKKGGIKNQGTIKNDHIVMKNYSNSDGVFDNQGTIETRLVDIFVAQGQTIGGQISASEAFIYRGTNANTPKLDLTATLNTPLLHILGLDRNNNNQVGLLVKNEHALDKVDAIKIESNGGRTTLGFDAGEHKYDGIVTLLNNTKNQDARIETDNGATLNLKKLVVEKGKGAIQTNNSSSITVDELLVKDSAKLNVAGWGDQNKSADITLNKVYLGKDAYLAAMDHSPNSHELNIKGDIALTLDSNAVADFVRPPLTGAQYETSEAKFGANSLTVTVLDAHSDSKVLLSEKNTSIKAENIAVTGAPSSNTGNTVKDLQALGNTVQYATKADGTADPIGSGIVGVVVKQEANDIYDGASATVGKNGLENMQTYANANINGIAEMTALGLHIWRNEIDDMNKRLGELRDSSADANGVWARVYNGKAKFGNQNITNKYTAFQFGYDHQVAAGTWLGGALSWTDGNNDFAVGGGDSSLLAFTGYGSKLWDNGMFLDVTGKVGRMKNEFDISLASDKSSASYHTNAVSVSAEAGWRLYPMQNSFYVEPQVELMYGHVFGVDYSTSTGVNVEQDSADTLIGRAGVVLGLKCPDNRGNAYLRASVLHDWKGDADFTFSKTAGAARTISEELGGTWYEYGIGANFNATKQVHLYADVEAANGGEVDTDYRVNFGLRYSY